MNGEKMRWRWGEENRIEFHPHPVYEIGMGDMVAMLDHLVPLDAIEDPYERAARFVGVAMHSSYDRPEKMIAVATSGNFAMEHEPQQIFHCDDLVMALNSTTVTPCRDPRLAIGRANYQGIEFVHEHYVYVEIHSRWMEGKK